MKPSLRNIIFGVVFVGTSSAAADRLHPIPFNYAEERAISVSACDEQSISADEIRALSAQRYQARQTATFDLIARFSTQVVGLNHRLYCRLGRIVDAIQQAIDWAKQQPMTNEFSPLEATRRLERIRAVLENQFQGQAEAHWRDLSRPERSGLWPVINRGTPEQAAYKTIQHWEQLGCTILAVRCNAAPHIWPEQRAIADYFNTSQLYSCDTLSPDCAPYITQIGQRGVRSDDDYVCQPKFRLIRVPSELDPNATEPSHCQRVMPPPVPARNAGTCASAESDADRDEVADALDGCPFDPEKTSPGTNGCNEPEICEDSDLDGSSDCTDECWLDPEKTSPGLYGCGVSDDDSDLDGTPDFEDHCPHDAGKIIPGTCGCGVSDADSDGDGIADCVDECLSDPAKGTSGLCGCGNTDADSDSDQIPDCFDGCANDNLKTSPGICGCGVTDADDDGDGALNCHDECPTDAGKTLQGACGCGVADTDADADHTADCRDYCPADPSVTVEATRRCSCLCKENGESIANSNGEFFWVFVGVNEQLSCADQNGHLCRNVSSGRQGQFAECELGFIDG